MPLTTLLDAKNSRLLQISQSCADSNEFLSLVNDATEMLMRRGSFWGTVQRVQVCTRSGCIVWPRYVGTPLAISVCNNPIPTWNNWWSFLPMSNPNWCDGAFAFSPNGSCTGSIVALNDGVTPVFNKIPCGTARAIQVFPSVQQDVGATVTIFGIDANGQTVRTQTASGIIQEGETVTLAVPFVQTVNQFQRIDRITKTVTQGVVRYFQLDSTTGLIDDLVVHEPTETTPMYRHSKISRVIGFNPPTPPNCQNACGGLRSIQALVKLEFVPVMADTDIVLIDNLQALKDMIMSIKEDEAGNTKHAEELEIKAVHELNLELRNKFPNSQTPGQVNCYGTARLEKQGIGTLI